MKHILLLIFTVALLASCSLFGKAQSEPVYMVTDRGTNKVMSAYYTDSAGSIVRTETYGDDALVKRARDFEYDSDGYVRSMVELVPGAGARTVTYSTEIVRGAGGRVEKVLQTSDDGAVYETYYGYDEAGTLRGTVIRTGGDTVIMKDYADE